jgi:hypothetical protein
MTLKKNMNNVEEEWCRGARGRMTLKRNMNKKNIWSINHN